MRPKIAIALVFIALTATALLIALTDNSTSDTDTGDRTRNSVGEAALGSSVDSDNSDTQGSSAESDDYGHHNLPAIVSSVDVATRAQLEPWFEEFASKITVGNPINEYHFVNFNDDLLLRIRSGQQSTFRFRISDVFDYEISVDYIHEFNGGWVLSGFLVDGSRRSEAKIFVNEDGTKLGNVFEFGVGQLIISPTGQLPNHVVYLRTGERDVD